MLTKDWTALVAEYGKIRSLLKTSPHPLADTLQKNLDAVIQNPTVQQVQALQKCIGMFDTNASGSLDHK